jgi:hypothetical protein
VSLLRVGLILFLVGVLRNANSTLVDSATGCELLSLLDYFSGYHQIWMNQEDEEKTNFITPFKTYCFRRMAEGLRNAGSTFACMTAKMFKEDKSIFAYIDDIIVQSKHKEDHIQDLERAFTNLRNAGLKLNPEKCIFGVSKGKRLGCLVLIRGIEANPEKNDVVINMEPPTSCKLAQRLAERLAALSRFKSRFVEEAYHSSRFSRTQTHLARAQHNKKPSMNSKHICTTSQP